MKFGRNRDGEARKEIGREEIRNTFIKRRHIICIIKFSFKKFNSTRSWGYKPMVVSAYFAKALDFIPNSTTKVSIKHAQLCSYYFP